MSMWVFRSPPEGSPDTVPQTEAAFNGAGQSLSSDAAHIHTFLPLITVWRRPVSTGRRRTISRAAPHPGPTAETDANRGNQEFAMTIVRGLPVSMTGFLLIFSAHAADRAVHLQVPPTVRPDVASMPLIADQADVAEISINAAVRRFDAAVGKAVDNCHRLNGSWTRTIDAPMRGPGYLSFVIVDSTYCGSAYPSEATMSIVYDLRTGSPVDWTHLLPSSLTGKVALTEGVDGTKMVTLASKHLFDLYMLGYHGGDDQSDCSKEVIRNAVGDGPPAMMAWLDAKRGGLAVQFDLPHVVQACAQVVVIPVATLRAEGAQPALIDAIQAAGQR